MLLNPHRFAAIVSTVFNASDKSSGITLSNGNVTASESDSTNQGVRSNTSKNSGKWFFSFVLNARANVGDWCPGLATSSANLAGGFNAAGLMVYRDNGQAWDEGSLIGTYTSVPTDGTGKLSVAVDFDAGKLWFGVSDTWVNSGDPTNGTNPTMTFTANSTWHIVYKSDNAGGTSTATLYPDTANGLTVPSGFGLWGSA